MDKTYNNTNRISSYSIVLHTISWIVLITFGWQQITYGADPSSRWSHQEKKVGRSYSVIEAIKSQKEQQDNMQRQAILEYHRNRGAQGVSQDIYLNQFLQNMEQMYANMQMQEQIWKARNLVDYANISYMEIPNVDGSIRTVWSRAGQTIAIENERIFDGFGNYRTRDTWNMQYNDRALLISYESKTTDRFGRETYVKWYGAEYSDDSVYYGSYDTDANKNLTAYYQEMVTHEEAYDEELGETLVYEVHSFQHVYDAVYSGKDMTSCIEEGYIEGEGSYYFERSGMGYDENQNLTSYHEVGWSQSEGAYITDWAGVYTNHSGRDDYNYDLLESYTMTTWSEATNETITSTYDAEFDESGHMMSFIQTEDSSIGGYTVRQRDNITYNSDDLIIEYDETLTDVNGEVTTVEFSGAIYDSNENLVYSVKKLTDAAGNVTETNYTASYNAIRQLIGYEETMVDDFGLAHETIWNGATYNILGQLTSYHQEEISSDNPNVTITTDYENITYDATGAMADYDAVLHTYGTAADGSIIDITETLSRDNLVFDEQGTLLSYQDVSISAGVNLYGYTVDLTVVRDVQYTTNINTRNQTYAIHSVFTENVHTSGDSTIALPSNWNEFPTGSRTTIGPATLIVDIAVDLTETNDYTYYSNSSGQIIGYDTISKSDASPDLITTINRTMIQYDVVGNIRGYHDSATSSADNITQDTLVNNITYDAANRMLTQIREVHTYGTGSTSATVDTTYTYVQSGITYDAQGNLTGYTEVETNSVTQVESVSVITDVTYNGLAQTFSKIVRSTSISTFEGLDYNITNEQRVYASVYNSKGQLISGVNCTIQDGLAELNIAIAISSLEDELLSQVMTLLTGAETNLAATDAALTNPILTQVERGLLLAEKGYYESEISYLQALEIEITAADIKFLELQTLINDPNADPDVVAQLALDARLAGDDVVDAFARSFKKSNMYDPDESIDTIIKKVG